ncbi:MAG: hypothetical protein SGJ27_18520 [Candidatus Melainabacteria bacterium]|nr:hypothetical protein [Candidatus Melainabacteria bacterium]
MEGEFFVFINVKQAAQFGHVGWGFRLEEDRYMFGATDHLYRHHDMDLPAWIDYMSVPPGEHTDWWCGYGTRDEMLQAMSRSTEHIWYHRCKSVLIAKPDPQKAEKAARLTGCSGWTVLTNNCVQQSYEIVQAYGAETIIPNPWKNPFNLIPRVWFNSFPGTVIELTREA